MPSYTSLIFVIVAKNNKSSFIQGLAKYQLDMCVFQKSDRILQLKTGLNILQLFMLL
ncbi:16656_t:CDS:2 [Cetraspora pellucida]|uniref:16656_t:CDS:1 n=1 Tax=Cetraspora pellucida TaxID=1433469 RepID=A0A9N9AR78_9GLOM|nr:16656_t:CDS:2 [Cetraspora pellucida]